MTALLLFALAAQPVPYLHDTELLMDTTIVPDTVATAVVSVRRAPSLRESGPVAGADVTLTVADVRATAKTDDDGRAVVRFVAPKTTKTALQVAVETRSVYGKDRLTQMVTVRNQPVLSLRTDRTIYGPGQTIHYVAAVMNKVTARPEVGAIVTLVVKDPKGTQIWRGEVETDATGFVAEKLPLGDDLVLGKYTISAEVLGVTDVREVEVREVELPPFFVAIDTAGRVTARHAYGEPVRGEVVLADGSGHRVTGELDEHGRFAFDPVRLTGHVRATVTDGAKRSHAANAWIPSEDDERRIAIVAENDHLRVDAPTAVTVLTTDTDGALAPTKVTLGGKNIHVYGPTTRKSEGAVQFLVRALSRSNPPLLRVRTSGGDAERSFSVGRNIREDLRTDRVVYRTRAPIRVHGALGDGTAPVAITMLRHGVPVASSVAVPNKGRFEATVAVPDGVFGLATIRAHELGWDAKRVRANRATAVTSIYLAPQRLDLALEGQTRHRPGQTAEILARVVDHRGRPAANVGLFASVIDERALALGAEQPGLVEVLAGLDTKKAKLLGAHFASMLHREGRAFELARAAVIRKLPPSKIRPFTHHDGLLRFRNEMRRATHTRETVVSHLVQSPTTLGAYDEQAGWQWAMTLGDVLRATKTKARERQTPWGHPLTWDYVGQLDTSIAFVSAAPEITRRRLQKLARVLRPLKKRQRRAAMKKTAAHLKCDAWGYAFVLRGSELVAPGPDGAIGTGDDLKLDFVSSGYGYGGLGARGTGMGGGGVAYGRAGRATVLGGPPPLRERFDEAVLWRSGIRTDGNGQAKIVVPFSDSVTGWKLAVDALGPNGAVGRAEKHLETFLPLSVDVAVPHRLTVGDRYTMKAVVANHTEKAAELRVRVRVGGALDLTAGAEHVLELPPGATGSVPIATTAARPGPATVDLELSSGERLVDRVRRKLSVVGPGRERVLAVSHRFTKQAQRIAFELPEAPEENSAFATLRLFRTPLDQALDGIDGLLREPHGCFEQTSSATYPNLMVLQLLEDEGPVRERAYRLVQKGYQRLVSYEVTGGGFSWFGQAPAHKALTAYGLMEFADMAQVYPVDPQLIARTQQWLIAQQQKDGSWAPDDRHLHDWSAVQGAVSATAFITWALAESGYRGKPLDRAMRYLARNASKSDSPYVAALYATARATIGRRGKLPKEKVVDDGEMYGANGQTLFFARGAAADIQVTALAALTHARLGRHQRAAAAVRWLWSAREPRYGWGSTQGTVLALKTAAAMKQSGPSEGAVDVALDGRSVGAVGLDGVEVPTLELPSPTIGAHAVAVPGSDGLLGDLRVRWRSKAPAEARERGLRVELGVPSKPVKLGDTGRVEVKLTNPTDKKVVMPTVQIPVPPGFAVDRASLKRMKRRRIVERFESDGTKVTLYLTKLDAGATKAMHYRLTAVAPCDVAHRGALAYAYYDPSVFGESAGRRVAAVER